jgi:hypothetical protein
VDHELDGLRGDRSARTAGLAAFDLLALRFGADSRELLSDDRRWRIR